MGNFLGDLGAAIRGHQEYQTYASQQEQARLRMEMDRAKLAEYAEAIELQKQERARMPQVAGGVMDYLQSKQPKGIAPPPVQPPMPGQQSVPMAQPSARYGQVPIGPQMGMMPQGLPPPPMGMPSQDLPAGGIAGGPPMPPAGPQTAPEAPIAPPPYQTVASAAAAPSGGFYPPGDQQGIPPPPPPSEPAPNSMSLQDAAAFIKNQGIQDPMVGMQILEKLTPYLNRDAQQEAIMLKMQLVHQDKLAAIEAQKANADALLKNKELDRNQREEIEKEKARLRELEIQMRGKKSSGSGGKGGGGTTMSPEDIEYWAEVQRQGGTLPSRMDKADIRAIIKATSRGTTTPRELLANQADLQGRKSEQRTIGTAAGNISMAGFEAEAAAKILEGLSEKAWRTSFVPINKALNAFNEKTGDPDIRAFGAGINTFVNTYARAISPKGVGTVSDKEHARELLTTADSPQAFKAIMGVLWQEMQAAQQTAGQARDKARAGQLGKPNPHEVHATGAPVQVQNAADYAKVPSGALYITPTGETKRKK